MSRLRLKHGAAVAAAVVLSVALVGTAVAGPNPAALTSAKVKKIAKKQIVKAAPKLSVKNASTVGGRSVNQLRTVVAGAEDPTIETDIGFGDGTVVVSVSYALVVPSTVHLSAVTELIGDGNLGDEATCVLQNDGVDRGLNFETTFDDVGDSDNSAVIAALTTIPTVPAGPHVARLFCEQNEGTGTIDKDDAAIQVTAVPR